MRDASIPSFGSVRRNRCWRVCYALQALGIFAVHGGPVWFLEAALVPKLSLARVRTGHWVSPRCHSLLSDWISVVDVKLCCMGRNG